MARIGIIGSGTWGTALTIHLSKMGHETILWSAFKEEIEGIAETHRHINLPNAVIPENVSFTSDLEEAMKDRDLLVLAVPSIFTRETARKMKPFLKKGQLIVNVAKGIEEGSLKTQTEITEEELPDANTAVLSGPSHAEEVSIGMPTAVVVGAHDKKTAQTVQNIFMSPDFRVYISPDMRGIEVGGSLKNVIALAAGIAAGLGYGDNTAAALMTRGVTELGRLGKAMGSAYETFYGLAGMGDLIVTCASKHSRNRRAGVLIGQGKTMDEAMAEVKMVVEGVYSAKAAMQLSEKYGVSMPIVAEVNKVLFEDRPASEAVVNLMCRDKQEENPDLEWERE